LLASAVTAPGPLWAANDRIEYQRATAAFHRAAKTPGTKPAVWRGIAGRFQAIYQTVPKSRRGAFALYSAALSYKEAWRSRKDWKDLNRAVSRFRRFAEVFSRNPLADDALMHLAELLATGYYDAVGALKAYRLVLKRHPRGDQAPAARKQMAALNAAIASRRPAPKHGGVKARFFRTVKIWKPAARPVKAKKEKRANTTKTMVRARPVRAKKERRAKTMVTAGPPSSPLHRPSRNATLRPLEPVRVRSVVLTRETSRKPARSSKERQGRSRRVKRVQIWSTLEVTRVILTTDPAVTFRSGRLGRTRTRPERLFFDLPSTLPGKDVAPVYPLDDGVLTRIRIVAVAGKHTRVVLDFDRVRRYEIKNFLLPSERKIVVDLYPPRPRRIAQERRGNTGATGRGAGKKPGGSPGTLSLKSSLGLKVRSIMLDPGHGGRDPGAIAYGLREKNVALAIAKRLRVLFKKLNPKLRVGMTRETDRYIPLHRRPALAKRFGADLFVSIHLNANPREGFHGIETYFLNLTGNASALNVAARENATTQKRISDLNNILVDLLRDTNIVESSQLAKHLHSSLVDSLKIHTPIRDLGVKQAPFLILMGAEMPSVLVEAGFLTNRRENRRLKTKSYINRIAKGIHAGLQNYIESQNLLAKNPPSPRIARGPDL
ncbi:MAG: N-acetylmuramoyl-L-alanine amidase, partial [bacterium]